MSCLLCFYILSNSRNKACALFCDLQALLLLDLDTSAHCPIQSKEESVYEMKSKQKFSIVARSIIHSSTQMCEMRPDEGNINQVLRSLKNEVTRPTPIFF